MNSNIAIVIGFDADDEPQGLYAGRDFEHALELLDSQPEGIRFIALYRNVTPTRRRETAESVLIEQKRSEDAEKRAAEQRAQAEAEAAGKAAIAKAEREAAHARAQAKAAEVEKSSNAKKLAEQAEILERIAADARAKATDAMNSQDAKTPSSALTLTESPSPLIPLPQGEGKPAPVTGDELSAGATDVDQKDAASAGADSSGAPGETTDPSVPATAVEVAHETHESHESGTEKAPEDRRTPRRKRG